MAMTNPHLGCLPGSIEQKQSAAMLEELLVACGGRDAAIHDDPVTISSNLAQGLIALLAQKAFAS